NRLIFRAAAARALASQRFTAKRFTTKTRRPPGWGERLKDASPFAVRRAHTSVDHARDAALDQRDVPVHIVWVFLIGSGFPRSGAGLLLFVAFVYFCKNASPARHKPALNRRKRRIRRIHIKLFKHNPSRSRGAARSGRRTVARRRIGKGTRD